jgi:long-chain acyl-CoA synthetase
MNITRTFDLLEKYKERIPKEDALCFKHNGTWVKYSSHDYIEYSYNLCYGLYELGLRPGDKIISISSNRPEWNFIDMGMSMLGIVHVPVFASLNTVEYEHIIRDSGAKMIFISDKKLINCVSPALESTNFLLKVYTFDKVEGASNWTEIVERGRSCSEKTRVKVDTERDSINSETFATLIYTSGTTGKPKGVMLSQKNLVSNFISAAAVFNLEPSDRFLSILPLCHVGGRMGNYQTQFSGASIYYAENMGSIAINMQEIKPNGFDAVPRVLEKFYDVIISKGKKLTGMKKILFFWAVNLGFKYKPFGGNGWLYEKKLQIANKLIFSKWRTALGGNVRIVGCGGASLNPRLERIFWAAGIKIINMYGLTETSPIITINRATRGGVKLGSVGTVIEDVEVKIAGDGEILCRGPNIMLGYYNDPELTKSAIDDDGWFHTGDIGYLDQDNFLMVTDRKKEIFKLSNGKFVAPQLIENIFKESNLIDQIMVVGEHEKFASALISPNFKYFNEWKSINNISFSDTGEMIKLQAVQSHFYKEIEKINRGLNHFERISRFRLVPDEWSPVTGELSPTLKLKRQYIKEKYSKLLDHIYTKES